MKKHMLTLFVAGLFALNSAARAENATYEGTWRTTNRKLDGTMTCAVSDQGDGKWRGRFFGVWQGVPFDYTVPFSGSSQELRGTATIDGASYTWKGEFTETLPRRFKGTFGGNRYTGSFDLAEKPPLATAAKSAGTATPR